MASEVAVAVKRETVEIRPGVIYISSARPANLLPTETYLVGNGDILTISIENVVRSTGNYIVRSDGMIDFALGGDSVQAAGKTVDEIAAFLSQHIKIVADPLVSVGIREFGSHEVEVRGAVMRPGIKYIQHEAIPFFVLRAEAIPDTPVTGVNIKRAGSLSIETLRLADTNTEKVLIHSGDSLEFITDYPPAVKIFYTITGHVKTSGQAELVTGLTLSQAIASAGGQTYKAKTAKIKRPDETGIVRIHKFNLQWIRDSKTTDPQLIAGDIIEIGN